MVDWLVPIRAAELWTLGDKPARKLSARPVRRQARTRERARRIRHIDHRRFASPTHAFELCECEIRRCDLLCPPTRKARSAAGGVCPCLRCHELRERSDHACGRSLVTQPSRGAYAVCGGINAATSSTRFRVHDAYTAACAPRLRASSEQLAESDLRRPKKPRARANVRRDAAAICRAATQSPLQDFDPCTAWHVYLSFLQMHRNGPWRRYSMRKCDNSDKML